MDIKELATLTAAEMDDVYLRNVPAIVLEQYCTRLIAAYLAEQEQSYDCPYCNRGDICNCPREKPAPPEPAPQQSDRDRQHEHTMKQFQEVCHGRNCTANKAQPTHSDECKADHDKATACEAPSSEEVARTVELLRINHWIPGNTKAADLIERLAARVPDERLATLEQQRDELLAVAKKAAAHVKPTCCDLYDELEAAIAKVKQP